jgi:hypothetical protein
MQISTRGRLPGTFIIRHKGNPDLVLANANGKAVLAWRDNVSANQLWTIWKDTQRDKIYWLENQQGRYLTVNGHGDDLSFQTSSQASEWNIVPDMIGAKFNPASVIRLASNTDWNLNALGNWPYDVGNRVGVWDWAGGDSNEVWEITEITEAPLPFQEKWVHAFILGKGTLSVSPEDQAGQLPLIIEGAPSVPQGNIRAVFAQIMWVHGFALRSRYNGRYLHWRGNHQHFGLADTMSLTTLWNGLGFSGTENWGLLRPYANPDQYWDLFDFVDKDHLQGLKVGTWNREIRDTQTWQISPAYNKIIPPWPPVS